MQMIAGQQYSMKKYMYWAIPLNLAVGLGMQKKKKLRGIKNFTIGKYNYIHSGYDHREQNNCLG